MKKVLYIVIICLSFGINTIYGNLACKNGNKLIGLKTMTEEDKARILNEHNKYREEIAAGVEYTSQPPAENMLELTWDDYAEKQATTLASTCVFEHNKPVNRDNSPMGQNLFIQKTTLQGDVNSSFNGWLEDMIRGWFNEINLYSFGSGFSVQTGHYTQLIWANTAKVGCGYAYFKEGEWYAGYLVCNYSPAGNYLGQDPYRVGKVDCKKNNLEPSNNYQNLCVQTPNPFIANSGRNQGK